MTRLPEIPPEAMTAAQRKVHDEIAAGPRGAVAGPFQVLLYSPALADCVQRLGRYVRYECALPRKLRELAILITARRWTAQYEWFVHEADAREAGLANPVIEALRAGVRPDFADPAEAEIYDFCTDLYETGRVGEAAFARILARHGAAGAVDLAGLLGHYNLIAITLNLFEVAVPDGSRPLPPRAGGAPPIPRP